jgi:hypothetical protein
VDASPAVIKPVLRLQTLGRASAVQAAGGFFYWQGTNKEAGSNAVLLRFVNVQLNHNIRSPERGVFVPELGAILCSTVIVELEYLRTSKPRPFYDITVLRGAIDDKDFCHWAIIPTGAWRPDFKASGVSIDKLIQIILPAQLNESAYTRTL